MSADEIEGTFRRISYGKFVEKTGCAGQSYKIEVPPGWFVISSEWISGDDDKKRRRLIHGKGFKIKKKNSKRSVYRVLRFSPNLEGSLSTKTGHIVLDWPGWLKLCDYAEQIPKEKEVELVIERLPFWQYPALLLDHPDPFYKVAGFLGLLSVILAVFSII